MDILYSGKVDGVCIVSSDSDYTRLATRLREAKMKVIGMGEQKTPQPFITACNKFISIEILRTPTKGTVTNAVSTSKDVLSQIDTELIKLLTDSAADLADESGWSYLGVLGNYILKNKTDFDPRNYGFQKLLPLIKSTGKFNIDEREGGHKYFKSVYIRAKQ